MSSNMFEGELVRLRGVEPEDWVVFRQWDVDSEAQRAGWRIFPPQGSEAAQAWAREASAKRPDTDEFRLVIETLDGTPVGMLNTHNADAINRHFAYGIAIAREHWGHGFAEEALTLVFRYMFEERGYHKVNAWIYASNERSLRMHEKLGMVREGRIRETHYAGGRFEDEIWMGMTAEEFRAREESRG